MAENIPELGALHSGWDQRRDAIHIAVVTASCTKEEPLLPGSWVKMDEDASGSDVDVVPCAHDDPDALGIVDPFLTEPVAQYKHFWLIMKPGTVKNLHHVWEHPSFLGPQIYYDDYDDSCRGC